MNNTEKDSATRLEEAQLRYSRSEKGRTKRKERRSTETYKTEQKRFFHSEKGKATQLKYRSSPKGVVGKDKRDSVCKLTQACADYLEQNPDKTVQDFLNETQEEATNE